MHLWLLENLNVENFWRCISRIFCNTTYINGHMQTQKKDIFIIFSQQICFTVCLNYHSCNFYSFFNLNHQFLFIYTKTQTFQNIKKKTQFFTLLQCWMMFLMLIEDPLSLVVWFWTWWWEKNWEFEEVLRNIKNEKEEGLWRNISSKIFWRCISEISLKMYLWNILTLTKI